MRRCRERPVAGIGRGVVGGRLVEGSGQGVERCWAGEAAQGGAGWKGRLAHLVEADCVDHEREVEGQDGDVGNDCEECQVCSRGRQGRRGKCGRGSGLSRRRGSGPCALPAAGLVPCGAGEAAQQHRRVRRRRRVAAAPLCGAPRAGIVVFLMYPRPCVTQMLRVHARKCSAVSVVAADGASGAFEVSGAARRAGSRADLLGPGRWGAPKWNP